MEVVVLKTKAASLERDAISKLKLDLHAFKINLLVEGLLTEGDEVQGMVHHFSSPAKKTHIHWTVKIQYWQYSQPEKENFNLVTCFDDKILSQKSPRIIAIWKVGFQYDISFEFITGKKTKQQAK